jgi:hypothetical protein
MHPGNTGGAGDAAHDPPDDVPVQRDAVVGDQPLDHRLPRQGAGHHRHAGRARARQRGREPWPPERPMLEGTFLCGGGVFLLHCHVVPTTDPDVR